MGAVGADEGSEGVRSGVTLDLVLARCQISRSASAQRYKSASRKTGPSYELQTTLHASRLHVSQHVAAGSRDGGTARPKQSLNNTTPVPLSHYLCHCHSHIRVAPVER